jgi:hypothetical protein
MNQINDLMRGRLVPQHPQPPQLPQLPQDDNIIPELASYGLDTEQLELASNITVDNDRDTNARDITYVPVAQEDTEQGAEDSTCADEQEQRPAEETDTSLSVNSGVTLLAENSVVAICSEALSQEGFDKIMSYVQLQFEAFAADAANAAEHRIELQREVAASKQKIEDLSLERNSLQSRLNELADQQARDRSTIAEMEEVKAKLIRLDASIEEVKVDVDTISEFRGLFENLIEKADILVKVAEEQVQEEAKQAEINVIRSDPYKKAFYETVCRELNSGYLAASAIDSGWIKNDKKGELGYFGSFVKEASVIVPFVGGGVKILGSVLKLADSKHQQKMITNYATIVGDGSVNKMNVLAEEVARKIVLANLRFDDKPETMVSRFNSRLKSMLMDKVLGTLDEEVGSARMKNLAAAAETPIDTNDISAETMLEAVSRLAENAADNAAGKMQEYITSAMQDAAMEEASDKIAGIKEETKQEKLGRDHALEVAKIITAGILSGKLKAETAEETVELILSTVIDQFADSVEQAGRMEAEDDTSQGETGDTTTLLAAEDNRVNNIKQLSCCTISYVTKIRYDNELLNHSELLKTTYAKYGNNTLLKLIELGSDVDIAEEIITSSKEQGVEQVLAVLFGNHASVSGNSKIVEESTNTVTTSSCGTDEDTAPLLGGACGLMESANLS